MAPFYVLIMQTSSMHEGQLLMDIEINLYKREILNYFDKKTGQNARYFKGVEFER